MYLSLSILPPVPFFFLSATKSIYREVPIILFRLELGG